MKFYCILFFVLAPIVLYPSHWKGEFKQKIKGNTPTWMVEQIADDFSRVETADLTEKRLDEIMPKSEAAFLVRYKIRGNVLSDEYPPCKTNHPRVNDMRKSLQTLLQCAPLPDLDFIIALGDAVDDANLNAPVFAFAKSRLHAKKIILIPDFEALQHTNSLLKEVRKGIEKYPWNKKKPIAFWRGACTGGNFNLDTFTNPFRSKLVALSLSLPTLIDARFIPPILQSDDPAAIVKNFGTYFGTSTPVKHHLEYKYQILVDGNTCAFARAYWQLFSNSVIFKQTSPNVQWYYRALEPGVHFIPFQDMSELTRKLEWAKKNDKEVEKITKNAQKFANENLKKSDVYYYLYLALKEYSKIQHGKGRS